MPEKKKHLLRVLLLVAMAAAILFVAALWVMGDASWSVSGMVFGDMELSMGEAVSRAPFCDAEWAWCEDDTVWLSFYDEQGNTYDIFFDLFNDDTQATIDAAFLNDESLDNVEVSYLLDYLDSGDYDEFSANLAAYAFISLLF